ncbi:hypothetical protein FO488_05290 [Geobacter sp. FeAm09]|uniref:hypothetical protein n=1 Tax=Geobacter sp. FeAm09 TaxID=2597769 RepID=UPI0011EC2B07|nr:hypothetical protein [Geobacter sp. FeAm09]QEM67623.1 hypothetical protein FO488_05290 [Geobacter sp. FeAm09]
MIGRATAARFSRWAAIFMALAGCAEKPAGIGDLYLESRTALEAYRAGNYRYLPTNRNITVTTKQVAEKVRIVAIGFVGGRKMALHLTFPAECLLKNATCLHDANREFDALKKCVDTATGGSPAPDSCSVSTLIINDGTGAVIRDRRHAPHMDVWVYDVD